MRAGRLAVLTAMIAGLGAGLAAAGVVAYVRLAPVDPARWHRPPPQQVHGNAGAVQGAVRDFAGVNLEQMDRIARAWPRTRPIAGAPGEGLVTYESRSAWIGFPDYTTLQAVPGGVRAHARQRFGRSDLGVNQARLDAWAAQLAGDR